MPEKRKPKFWMNPPIGRVAIERLDDPALIDAAVSSAQESMATLDTLLMRCGIDLYSINVTFGTRADRWKGERWD